MKKNKRTIIYKWMPAIMVAVVLSSCAVIKPASPAAGGIYAKTNLVAWCIVPYDSKKRNSEERAQMLDSLGIKKMAYDWRQEHLTLFDAELQALKRHNIKLQAFWLYAGADPVKDGYLKLIIEALKRNHVKTDIWLLVDGIDMTKMTQEEKVAAHLKPIRYIAEEAAKIGCRVGLYNDNGWYGEPENQLAIIDSLKMPNIGMVYNFHHAEDQVNRFAEFYPKILPHLLAITVSGLKGHDPAKVVIVGEGDQEYKMMRMVKESSYKGPINIINEETRPDAKEGLKVNMAGVVKVLKAIGDTAALKTYSPADGN
jgi:sugar phosphate isomerase/epimerase